MQPPALEIHNLEKIYANGVHALRKVSFQVLQGDFFALLGPNGAGKSTIIGILTSLVRKSSGQAYVFGYDIDEDFATAKSYVGVVPQEYNFSIFDKVEDTLIYQAGYYGIPRKIAKIKAEQYLKQLNLWEKRHSSIRSLSGGMKRRLMIARALIHEPKILILDEPTAGVDIEIRRTMWKFLSELNAQGVTIILTTHYLEEAETLCRHIAIIDEGEIIENTSMSDLLKQLDSERFILYLKHPVKDAIQIPGYKCWLQDENTLEVEVAKDKGINPLFAALSSQNIDIISLRNKTNRLEELFLRLTQEKSNNVL